jgi:hypothetical protein
METEEALYAAVGEELRQGNIRQGLWAKALAEEGYDKQKAKARYLKLRVRSLRKEIADAAYHEQARVRAHQEQEKARVRSLRKEMADAAYQKQARARAHQEQRKAEAIQSGFQQLEWRTLSLSKLQRARGRIRTAWFWPPFVVAFA